MKITLSHFKGIILSSAVAFLCLFPTETKGAEFVVINKIISYDINAGDAFWSFYMNGSMPSNWATPNDYYHGTFYTRYEILSVPTNVPCGIQFGIFQWQGAHNDSCGELCETIRGPLAGVGDVVTNSSSPATWWKAEGGVDFSRMSYLQSMAIVLYSWDTKWPVSKPGNGGDPGGVSWSQRFNWFPLTLRVTVVAVSAGSTFSGWDNYIPNPALQKPTPDYGIDYINETTNKVVPSTDEFSSFPTMYGTISGTGQKMPLIPGQDAYFRTKAGDGKRKSEIQHFDIPCRPATPTFKLDNVNHRTTTVVSSEYEYADFADMLGATTGNGTYVNIPAGTTKFFRKKATSTSFKSKVLALNESTMSPIAHELLIFNDIIDFPNVTDTNGFYYFNYNADMPKDWKSPEDYYNGKFYMRYEIISQKAVTAVGLQFGLWQLLPTETGELHETMSGITTLWGPGTVATEASSPSTWWSLDGGFDYTKMDLTWHMGINPWKVDGYGDNVQIRQENASVWAERNTYWFPMKVKVTIVAVASGYGFSGFSNYTPLKPALPAYTANFATAKTNQVVAATDEYSYSPTMSPAYSGTGVALDIQPGQTIYFRTKAQGINPASDIQRLIIDARPSVPAYSIDFVSEKTAQTISVNDEYANNIGMAGASAGSDAQLTVTPGSNLYFRTKATTTSFGSAIQTLEVPARPQNPAFTINYATGTTVESAGTNMLYSVNSNLSDPHYGTGSPIVLEPGQDLYLKQVAGSSSFNSGVSHLVVPGNNYLGYSGSNTITQKKFTCYAILVDGSSAFALNNLQITNGTAQNLKPGNVFDVIPAAEGNVTVVVPANSTKAGSFASNTITVFYDDQATAIDDPNINAFRIYPNPSADRMITIQTPSANADRLDIYSIDGAFVKSIAMNNCEYQLFDLQDLNAGMYLLKIRTNEGISIQKVVLQ